MSASWRDLIVDLPEPLSDEEMDAMSEDDFYFWYFRMPEWEERVSDVDYMRLRIAGEIAYAVAREIKVRLEPDDDQLIGNWPSYVVFNEALKMVDGLIERVQERTRQRLERLKAEGGR